MGFVFVVLTISYKHTVLQLYIEMLGTGNIISLVICVLVSLSVGISMAGGAVILDFRDFFSIEKKDFYRENQTFPPKKKRLDDPSDHPFI